MTPGKQRLSDQVERRIVGWIVDGRFGPGTTLPLEREMAVELGVGRPTLREAISRLERDGWITVRKGSATVVNDYLSTGTLNVIPAIIGHPSPVGAAFVAHMLDIRTALAPVFIGDAVARDPARVVATLAEAAALSDDPRAFARFDWELHRALARLDPNPVFLLILNSFDPFYETLAARYFAAAENRQSSLQYYQDLLAAAMDRDGGRAREVAVRALAAAGEAWNRTA